MRRFVFDDVILTEMRTAALVEQSVALFAERGFGLWMARSHQDDALVGFGGLWYFRDPPELELLYGVADESTGRGYGREIAGALVGDAHGRLGMTAVRASTDEGHTQSRRLLDDLGFRLERAAVVEGRATAFYVHQH